MRMMGEQKMMRKQMMIYLTRLDAESHNGYTILHNFFIHIDIILATHGFIAIG